MSTVLAIILIAFIVGIIYFGLSWKQQAFDIPEKYKDVDLNLENLVIDEISLTYLLYKLGVNELHTPILSLNTP